MLYSDHNTTMIRKKSLYFKSFHSNTSPEFIFSEFMNDFVPEKETCPYCSSSGNCRIHAYYFRSLVWFDGSRQICFRLKILRVKCESCGHTHAVLPDVIIPYACYGIQFILSVLGEFFGHSSSAADICRKYDISQVLLFRWVRIFRKDKRLSLGALNNRLTSQVDFLSRITGSDFCEFSVSFIRLTSRSFLQTHKNPAVYRQTVF